MITVECPNCGRSVEMPPEFLGKQVGCLGCKRVYFLSRQYHDLRYKQLFIINAVAICLLVSGIFLKIELDYKFIGRSAKAARKTTSRKYEELFGKQNDSKLSFYDFDTAYGTVQDKLNRTKPVILPEHKGQVVQWGGEVLGVHAVIDSPYGAYYVRFRQTNGAASDVTVYFLEDQGQSLAKIQKGLYLNYQGIIVSAGYGNIDHILKRGKILD